MAVTKAQVKTIALSFPGAFEKRSYGNPAIFIEKKFFTRIREEDNSLVLVLSGMEEREMKLELDSETYFITDHYRDYPAVLVRLAKVTAGEVKTMLERRWRQIAPKRMLKEIEEGRAQKPAKKPAKAKKTKRRKA